MSQPTSKNLFSIAKALEESNTRSITYAKAITNNKDQDNPGALNSITKLIRDIRILTDKNSLNNSHLRKLLGTENPLNGKTKRSFITINIAENKITVTVKTDEITKLINDIREAAKSLEEKEQKKSQNRWYNRGWAKFRNMFVTNNTTNKNKMSRYPIKTGL